MDSAEMAATLREMLDAPEKREQWARSAQRRVHDEYLIFTQLKNWLRVLASGRNPKCDPRNRKRKK
jgi:trehalose synthase